jgi:hypothetical protein
MDNSSIGLCDMQAPVPPLMSDCPTPSSVHAATGLQPFVYSGLDDNLVRAVTLVYQDILQQTKSMLNLSWVDIAAMLTLFMVAYLSSLIIYRTTHWYEFYYTYIQTGMYYKKVAEFHAKYGESDRC